jgi:hypothetical protein
MPLDILTFHPFPSYVFKDFFRRVINRFVIGSYSKITELVSTILADMLVY